MLRAALENVLRGEASSLDQALGLRPKPGQRTIATTAKTKRRDELLRRTAADFYPGHSPTVAAHEIYKIWSRYAESAWPRERIASDVPINRIDTPQFYIWQIMRLQDHVLSERTIRLVLAAS